jgi:hypothetical protein
VSDITITFTDALVVMTCWCGINHAVPQDLRDFQQRQHDNGDKQTGIYCPLGHSHIKAGPGKAKRLQRDLERADERARGNLRALETERRRHSATKGQLTKVKKRIGKGICPCCNRHFANVERHMATQHPDLHDETT